MIWLGWCCVADLLVRRNLDAACQLASTAAVSICKCLALIVCHQMFAIDSVICLACAGAAEQIMQRQLTNPF